MPLTGKYIGAKGTRLEGPMPLKFPHDDARQK